MKKFLSEDNPELWEKVKDHGIEIPDDWQGEYPLFCKHCKKRAIQANDMLWICPVQFDIPNEYFHAG